MTVEELQVLITAQTSGLEKQIKGVKSQLSSLEKSATNTSKKLSSTFKTMFKGFSVVAIVAGLTKVSKQAISTASDLQEVQNVVDVAFGAAAEEINKFASTAIEQLGMSEYTAKHMASTFMSMSNGMGITADSGKNMSIELTKLAGDMASFYNVEQDVAQTALNSVFTGETESLKKFGVVMTEANLTAFALSQGITKSYKAMSQSEKVMLRYKYVMNATKNAQGDFARTSNSWANQTRILKEQWSQFLGIMGKGLIQVLTPVVQSLNKMLGYLISIGNSISKVFGGTSVLNSTTAVSDVASSAGELDTGLNEANTSAKKLQKTLGNFDELNVMADNSSDSDSSSEDSGLDIGSTITADTAQTEQTEEGVKSRLKDFIDECKDILNKWKDTIPKLEFNFDTDKALEDLKNIGLNILNVIAGWGSFIIYIGVKIANDLDIGNLLQKFIGLMESATNLASAITDALVPAFEIFYDKAISPLVKALGEIFGDVLDTGASILDSWAQWFRDHKEDISVFAEKLGDCLAPLADIVAEISKKAWETFRDIIVTISDAFQNLATWIVTTDSGFKTFANAIKLFAGLKILDTVIGFKGLWTSVQNGYPILSYLGDLIKAPFQLLLGGIATAVGKVKVFIAAIGQMFGSIASAIGSFFATFGTIIAGVSSVVGGVILAIVGFVKMWTDGWSVIGEILKDVGIALVTIGAILLGAAAWPAVIVAAVVAAVSTIIIVVKDHWAEIKEGFKKLCSWLKDTISNLGTKISDWFKNIFEKCNSFFNSITDKGKNFVNNIKQKLSTFLENCKQVITNVMESIKNIISTVWNTITIFFTTTWNTITSIFTVALNKLKSFLDNMWNTIKNVITNTWNTIKKFFSDIWSAISSIFTSVLNSIKSLITSIFSAIQSFITSVMNSIKSTIENIMNTIQSIFSTCLATIQNLWTNMCETVKNLVSNLKTNLTNLVNNIKDTFVNTFTTVKDKVSNLFTGLKDSVLNIMNSLKTAIKTPINGIIGFINGLISGVVTGMNKMIDVLNKLSFDVPDWVPEMGGKTFGFNISKLSAPSIPLLANGGVISSPTVAMMGEYAGASNNPEIVAPQSILRDTMSEANEDLIDTLIQLNRQLISAISGIDMSVKIGDDTIANSVIRANNKNLKLTGQALI